MAEIAVTLLIDKLVQLLVQEGKLLNSVHREVVGIGDEQVFPKRCQCKGRERRPPRRHESVGEASEGGSLSY